MEDIAALDMKDEFYWSVDCKQGQADTVIVVLTAIFVLLQTPAFGLAQAGLLRRKNSLSIIMQALVGLCIGTTLWYTIGFTLVFGPSRGGFIGSLEWAFLVHPDMPECYVGAPKIPIVLFCIFQMFFSVLTPVAVTGAWGDKTNHATFLGYVTMFPIVIYYFITHWIWNPHGWLAVRGVVDYAGGIVVFTTVGAAGLVGTMLVDRKQPGESFGKHNMPLFVTGALFLWFGFYAWAIGSAYAAGAQASHALINTHLAACSAGLTWVGLSYASDRHWHLSEIILGALAGVAGISAGSGYVQPFMAFVIGIVVSFVGFFSSKIVKNWFSRYDAMDVVSVWGVPGACGALLVGFCADMRISGNANIEGIFRDTHVGGRLLLAQFIGVSISIVWAAAWSWVLLFLLKYTYRLDLTKTQRRKGLDLTQIGESAYDSLQAPSPADMTVDQVTGKLCEFAALGNTVELERLIERGADPSNCDWTGRTPAHYAAQNGRLNVVQYLGAVGVDLNVIDDEQKTPLQDAIDGGHIQTARWLRLNGGLLTNEGKLLGDLLWAVQTGNADEVERILEIGLNVNGVDYDGRSPLILAAAEGNLEIVEMLMDAGADLGLRDRWGRTALDEARQFRHDAVAQLLRQALSQAQRPEADEILWRDAESQQPEHPITRALCAAAASGNNAEVERLTNAGVPVEVPDYDGRTAMHLAAAYGHASTVQLLLKKGASINRIDRAKQTPLMLAMARNHHPLANWMKQNSAVVVNKHHGNKMCNLAANGDIEGLAALINQGVDVNIANVDGRTALHLASCYGHVNVVQYLLTNGAFVRIRDRYGNTALDDAARHMKLPVVELLLRSGAAAAQVSTFRLIQQLQAQAQAQAQGVAAPVSAPAPGAVQVPVNPAAAAPAAAPATTTSATSVQTTTTTTTPATATTPAQQTTTTTAATTATATATATDAADDEEEEYETEEEEEEDDE